MGSFLLMLLIIAVLSIIPAPKRNLSKRPRYKSSRIRRTLPWFDSNKKGKRY